ncbi:hypothetical protein Pmani_015410 [Petrolisthes manimaculis]|uniref:Ionotropic glutamate receptor L-glutamate and glycine-binding domain-containing protein n=1 Tax=Petrolisthes manimaculis TaxID=1843537 RepID=A0AAE1U7E5_9EUCA|nr:hypothetical protein Pmani_015410 [Petrolisthes manimaculis]
MSTVLVNVRYEPFTLPGNDMEAGLLVSLVLFLLQPSQHTEVVIIHDYTLPALTLSQLLVALTSFHTNDLRYMVLLCSANTTWTVFDMVSRYNLESRRVRWLVLGEEPIVLDTFLPNLREGSMVGLAAPTTPDVYKIYSSYVNLMNQVRFQEVGMWTVQGGNIMKVSLRRPLFFDILQLYRNFHGRQLITMAVDNWPFFEVIILEDGTAVAGRGTDVNIINTLSSILNFTYRVEIPADKQWGTVREDGTVTGMVGEVAARRAHLAIDEITITASRETVVDFSYPYFFDTTTIVSRAPAERNRSLAVFYPFSSHDKMGLRTRAEGRRDVLLQYVQNDHHPGELAARVLLATQTGLFLLVAEKNTAWIGGIVSLEIHAIRYLKNGYHISLNKFYPQPYGIVCPPRCSLHSITESGVSVPQLGRLVQAGIVYKWHRDEVTKLMQSPGQGRTDNQVGEVTSVGQESVAGKPLALDHLQGAFYIAGCGALLAGNVLFTEVITHYFNLPPSRTKSSYYVE